MHLLLKKQKKQDIITPADDETYVITAVGLFDIRLLTALWEIN